MLLTHCMSDHYWASSPAHKLLSELCPYGLDKSKQTSIFINYKMDNNFEITRHVSIDHQSLSVASVHYKAN